MVKKTKKSKPRRSVALQEIRTYQEKNTGLLLPRSAMSRLIRKITYDHFTRPGSTLRFQPEALLALHESAEAYLVQVFEDANLCTLNSGRQTVQVKDIQTARRIKGPLV